jgi:D-alanyl-D-alanine endopeptidase (penicillin-binding protein 7)
VTSLAKLLFSFGLALSVLLASTPTMAAKSSPTVVAKAPTAGTAKKKPQAVKPVNKPRVKARMNGKARTAKAIASKPALSAAARLSAAERGSSHSETDKLAVKSSVALVMDQDTNEVLFSKNSQAVLPIASITKLMTAVVVSDAGLPLDEVLTVTEEDVDTEKGSRSRLVVGARLTRGEMLHLALMSSENRAASALGRNYPGGLASFVSAMNAKAQLIGMTGTHYVEPTGLSSQNQSSATDLATLVKVAHDYPLIRELSTSPEFQVEVGRRKLDYHNTNRLVRNPSWDIGLQKTGYIAEAGRCLVMQASLAGRKLIMVFLDSSGLNTRLADAERVRRWVTSSAPKPLS